MAHKMSYGKGYKKGSMGKKGSMSKSMDSDYGMGKHYARREAMGGYVEKRMVPKGPYAPK